VKQYSDKIKIKERKLKIQCEWMKRICTIRSYTESENITVIRKENKIIRE